MQNLALSGGGDMKPESVCMVGSIENGVYLQKLDRMMIDQWLSGYSLFRQFNVGSTFKTCLEAQ
jgi:hypothetical protein